MTPKVSLCIPAYREADKLAKLLDSIASQDFRDFEVIVSDDSPDNAVQQICEAYPALAIRYFRNTPAKGSPGNWNFAIAQARAPWVKLMHHDDYFYDSRALGTFYQASEAQPHIDYFFSDTYIFDSHRNTGYVYEVDQQVLGRIHEQAAYLFHRNIIGAPSVGFFKNGLPMQFDEQLIWLVDIEFYCRLLGSSKVAHISEPLVTTVISDSQLTSGLRDVLKVEVGEFLYAYHKLHDAMDALNLKMMHMRMLDLCVQFNLKSEAQLREAGMMQPIPSMMKRIMRSNRMHPRLAQSLFYRLFKFDVLR